MTRAASDVVVGTVESEVDPSETQQSGDLTLYRYVLRIKVADRFKGVGTSRFMDLHVGAVVKEKGKPREVDVLLDAGLDLKPGDGVLVFATRDAESGLHSLVGHNAAYLVDDRGDIARTARTDGLIRRVEGKPVRDIAAQVQETG